MQTGKQSGRQAAWAIGNYTTQNDSQAAYSFPA